MPYCEIQFNTPSEDNSTQPLRISTIDDKSPIYSMLDVYFNHTSGVVGDNDIMLISDVIDRRIYASHDPQEIADLFEADWRWQMIRQVYEEQHTEPTWWLSVVFYDDTDK